MNLLGVINIGLRCVRRFGGAVIIEVNQTGLAGDFHVRWPDRVVP